VRRPYKLCNESFRVYFGDVNQVLHFDDSLYFPHVPVEPQVFEVGSWCILVAKGEVTQSVRRRR
jgi:hypothetical protein